MSEQQNAAKACGRCSPRNDGIAGREAECSTPFPEHNECGLEPIMSVPTNIDPMGGPRLGRGAALL